MSAIFHHTNIEPLHECIHPFEVIRGCYRHKQSQQWFMLSECFKNETPTSMQKRTSNLRTGTEPGKSEAGKCALCHLETGDL